MPVRFVERPALELARCDDKPVITDSHAASKELDVAAVNVAVPIQHLNHKWDLHYVGNRHAGVNVEFAGAHAVQHNNVAHSNARQENNDESLETLAWGRADAS